MLVNYRVLCSMVLLGLSMGTHAFIYEIKILRKWNPSRQKYHYFIGLSDFHDKTNDSNQSQLNKLVQLLGNMDKKKTRLVIEDLSSRNSQGRKECGHFYINSHGGILGGLADTSKNMGLEVDNIEFRYCRVSSLGPILNKLTERLNNFPSAIHVRVNAIKEEIMQEIQEINRYSDGYVLDRVYARCIKDVLSALKALHLDVPDSLTVADYLAQHSTQQNRLEILKKLLTFDSNLLDIKITHAVMQSGDKDKVIAIAGGAHIARVCELLMHQGYSSIDATKVSFAREHDLERCLGSHIVDGAFCIKPAPIDLRLFEKAVALP